MKNFLAKYNISNTDALVMILAIMLQGLTAIWAKDDMLSFISGMAGIISVVLCSQKKLTFYLFGFIQLFTYVVLCFRQHLWGEVAENAFYFVTMVVGIVIWVKNYNREKYEVVPKELSFYARFAYCLAFILGTFIVFAVLKIYSNDSQPFWDAISTVPAFIAQILMIAGYKEQWRYWLIVDVTSIVMWSIIGNPCMVVQFILWTLNCLYGMYKWNENSN